MRKFFLVALMFVAALTLAACDSKKEATAYGLVHGHYVGEVTVALDKDGKVESVVMEEYFLPYSWAKTTQTEGADVLTVVGTARTGGFTYAYYAKYIKIGDKLFTGSVIGEEGAQSIKYSAEGIADIEEWVKNHDNAKWYVKQVNANKFFIADSAGKEHATLTRGDATSNTSMKKSEAGYWVVDAPRLGWKGNIEAMVSVLVGMDLSNVKPADYAKVDGVWNIGDVVTAATLTDFADYINLAVAAFNAAK